ncbi:MAG: hypothetical protein ABIR57_07430 [Aeromicrobium sp.]
MSQHPYWGIVSPEIDDPSEPEVHIANAAALMTSRSVMTGWAAVRHQGVHILDGRDRSNGEIPISIASPGRGKHRHQAGLLPTRRLLLPGEILDYHGIRVATIARAAYDMALDAPSLREAVVVIDMCISTVIPQSRTTLGNIRDVVERHVKTRGIVQARRAVDLASARSASPWETRTRLIAELDAGLKGLLVNAPVFDLLGNLLGIADLLDPATGLVIEFDGSGHREEMPHSLDNIREEKFERSLMTVVRVSSVEHRNRGQVAARLRAAQRDANGQPRDRWTLEIPRWWWGWPQARRWD